MLARQVILLIWLRIMGDLSQATDLGTGSEKHVMEPICLNVLPMELEKLLHRILLPLAVRSMKSCPLLDTIQFQRSSDIPELLIRSVSQKVFASA